MTQQSNARPNIVVIMSDEHGAEFSGAYGHDLIETPVLDRMAAEGVTFDAAYCNAPLCVPSRLSFMTGQFNTRCEGFDNATALRLDAMTWPYLLRNQGYDVVLSGKMHLIGVDHLHGFRAQLARDLHAELHHPLTHWDVARPPALGSWSGVQEAHAGDAQHIDADVAAVDAAVAYLGEAERQQQLFALCIGPIAPHFPFVVPEPYFSQYYPDKADLPEIPDGHLENLPIAAQRARAMFGFSGYDKDDIRRARAAYYGMISFVDDQIGRVLDALEANGLSENTVVIYTSDHGEMLGEHGLWRKMCFYEQSARVPLQVMWPGQLPAGKRVEECVSLVDLTATLLDLGGVDMAGAAERYELDGDSLLALMGGATGGWKDEALCEHSAHGTDRPMAMLRAGKWKLCAGFGDPLELELYDLEADPGEYTNLAGQEAYAEVQARMLERLGELWDGEAVREAVLRSQRERALINDVAPDRVWF